MVGVVDLYRHALQSDLQFLLHRIESPEPDARGGLGRAYAGAGLAADVRLACHGLDTRDNDFVIGLVGRALHPLSHLVQAMRKTRQTSQYMQQMGPFFIGNALYQSNPKEFANPAGL